MTPEQETLNRSLNALRLELPDAVWQDVNAKVGEALAVLEGRLADAETESERLRATWEKDNLCGICPYREAIQAKNEVLEGRLAEATEALRDDPDKWSFWTLVRIARLILETDYPPEVFNGSSGDPGPVFVTRLREALEPLEALRAEPATPTMTGNREYPEVDPDA